MKFPRYKHKKPTRNQLDGYSFSEFKTLLQKFGFKVGRSLQSEGWCITHKNHAYRFRWWNDAGFVVDVSCPIKDFDRWANSTEQTMLFKEWYSLNNNVQ